MKNEFQQWRGFSLDQLKDAQKTLEKEIAGCCFEERDLQYQLNLGRSIESLALSCLRFVADLEARILEREKQVKRLEGNK